MNSTNAILNNDKSPLHPFDVKPPSIGTLYTLQRTDDESFTLKNKELNECCHSEKGALSESLYYYTECNDLKKRFVASQVSPFWVFDLGFGIGLNFLATLQALKPQGLPYLHYVSVEIEEELVNFAQENWKLLGQNESLGRLKKTTYRGLPCYQTDQSWGRLTILVGDARKLMPTFVETMMPEEKFKAIYQDPFSPAKAPELWNGDWFSLLKKASHPSCILTTFSQARLVRDNLQFAGWEIEKIKGFAFKRGALKASLSLVED